MSISTKGSVLMGKRRLIAYVVVALGVLSLLLFAVSMKSAPALDGPGERAMVRIPTAAKTLEC